MREKFEKIKKDNFTGLELLFELSNEKYINWLEQRLEKYDSTTKL